jgi:TPR repeat protein
MKASQGQHSGALYVLGYMLFETAQNDQELNYALEHLKKSSQLGYPPAKTYFGSILLHNAQTEEEKIYALELLRSAALAGDNDAASTLHHIYVSGLYNEPKNLCMASYWLDISKKKNRSDGVVSNTKAADCFVENELKISK